MFKYLIAAWLVFGASLGAAYFSPPVQRLMTQAEARDPLRSALEARARAVAMCRQTGDAAAAREAAVPEWTTVLAASRKALVSLADACGSTKIRAQVLEAESLAQTGEIDQAMSILWLLEEQLTAGGDAESLEIVRAALAHTNYQVAVSLQKESSDDDAWIPYAETSIAYLQQLSKQAGDAAAVDAYRKNLACVTQFLFGEMNSADCWAMPSKPTANCKKKMRRMERERPKGGSRGAGGANGGPKYTEPPADESDPIRRQQIEKTKRGEDLGI